jgi:hypothetical protein
VSDEELIGLLAVTAEVACRRMTPGHLDALAVSVAQAESLPAKPDWDRKAVAHAEAIGLLGEATGDPVLIRVTGQAIGWTHYLAVRVGPVADGIILNSRRRLLRHLRAGDPAAAAHEMEAHLRTLRIMERLSRGGRHGRPPPRPAPAAPRGLARPRLRNARRSRARPFSPRPGRPSPARRAQPKDPREALGRSGAA